MERHITVVSDHEASGACCRLMHDAGPVHVDACIASDEAHHAHPVHVIRNTLWPLDVAAHPAGALGRLQHKATPSFTRTGMGGNGWFHG